MHAVGVQHEHQNPLGPCEGEFRWYDDFGYEPTRDARGAFVNDSRGLRPGVYTFLAGYPNHWSRAKVDHNLRRIDARDGTRAGGFDAASVMLYRFPQSFYRAWPSLCAPSDDVEDLSDSDKDGLALLYPPLDADRRAEFERLELIGASVFGSEVVTGITRQSAEPKLVEVGRTKDACAGGNGVRFTGASGEVTVAAGSAQLVRLPAAARELFWYCGGSRERCANDQPFDHVLCERAGNGAISWVFYLQR
jgi:hypothetical protein